MNNSEKILKTISSLIENGILTSKDIKKDDWIIEVDRDKCISAASCVAASPASFELDDEGKAVILRGIDEEDNLNKFRENYNRNAIKDVLERISPDDNDIKGIRIFLSNFMCSFICFFSKRLISLRKIMNLQFTIRN